MRIHERTTAATAREAGEQIELVSPSPGLFRIRVQVGDIVRPGTVLGELEILGQLVAVVAPPTARGAVVAIADPMLARPAVDHGAVLVVLDPRGSVEAIERISAAASTSVGGLVFRAPTSGRFYGRAAPDKPPFVAAGTELAAGATICLLEVMKTFHRVTYGGGELPPRARVTSILVGDGDDVNAGDPLLALEAL